MFDTTVKHVGSRKNRDTGKVEYVVILMQGNNVLCEEGSYKGGLFKTIGEARYAAITRYPDVPWYR